MGDGGVDVAPTLISIEGLIHQKTDAEIDAALDLMERAISVMIVAEIDEDTVETMAMTEHTEGVQALSRALQMFGAIGIECQRRMVIAATALREMTSEDPDD